MVLQTEKRYYTLEEYLELESVEFEISFKDIYTRVDFNLVEE